MKEVKTDVGTYCQYAKASKHFIYKVVAESDTKYKIKYISGALIGERVNLWEDWVNRSDVSLDIDDIPF